jgi:hypothetical protein
MTAVCLDVASLGCTAVVNEIETPVFDVRLDDSDASVANATRFVLTGTWNASTETAKTIHVRVVDRSTEEVKARWKGTSPLTLEIPRETLGLAGSYRIDVDPDTGGVFVNQVVQLRMDLV